MSLVCLPNHLRWSNGAFETMRKAVRVRGSSVHRSVALAWPWLLGLLIVAPLLRPGYVLSYDMVFVPDQAWRSQYLGLGDGLPRAVPSDALVSWLSVVVPSWLLQKGVLLGVVGVGGWGIARLIPADRRWARLAAVSWFVWNPYVAERLLLGQWVVLMGYAALPWVVAAARRARQGDPAALAGLLVACAVAATSASGGVQAAVLGLTVLLWPGARAGAGRRLAAVAGVAAVNLPWAVAGLLHREAAGVGADAVRAFAAAGEGHLGVLLSALGLGGVWNAETVPDSRVGWVAVVWTAILLVVVALGVRPLVDVLGRQVTLALGVVAGAALIVALAGAMVPDLLAAASDALPGLGLLRDGTRYLGALAVFEALTFGLGVERVARRMDARLAARAVGVGLVLAPLAAMPDLAWGVGGRLSPVDYPQTWSQAREAMVAHGGDGQVLVLPASPYRAYAWNDRRPGLDPAPRFFPHNMLSSDALMVDGRVVQPESAGVQAAVAAFEAADAAELQRLGVGFVIVDADDGPSDSRAQAAALGATPLFQADDIAVYALDEPAQISASGGERAAVAVAWGAAAVTLCASIGLIWTRRRPPRRRSAQRG